MIHRKNFDLSTRVQKMQGISFASARNDQISNNHDIICTQSDRLFSSFDLFFSSQNDFLFEQNWPNNVSKLNSEYSTVDLQVSSIFLSGNVLNFVITLL